MDLPVRPPVSPMLARLPRELPRGDFLYEPKWDGFRCLAFRSGHDVDLRSRNDRRLGRYFPELVEALRSLPGPLVLDGEIVLCTEEGFDFQALLSRLHPATTRIERLANETPALFVAFDLLAVGREDLRERPFCERRDRLTQVLGSSEPPLFLTPLTEDAAVAAHWMERFQGAGVDGVVAKRRDLGYRPGERAMVKVKWQRTAECVVAGYRLLVDRPAPSSLLLGLYDGAGVLQHVGLASGFSESLRRRLADELPLLVAPIEGHPWEQGFLVAGSLAGRLKGAAARWTPDMGQDWIPVRPTRVCEVAYDQLDRDRFRYTVRFLRWRPDRNPRSCTFEQFEQAPGALADVLGTT